jgi:hypothetical protein
MMRVTVCEIRSSSCEYPVPLMEPEYKEEEAAANANEVTVSSPATQL